MFEPRDADNPEHGAHDYGTDAKHGKLCGCVAFVQRTVGRSFLFLRMWGRGRQAMHVQDSENTA